MPERKIVGWFMFTHTNLVNLTRSAWLCFEFLEVTLSAADCNKLESLVVFLQFLLHNDSRCLGKLWIVGFNVSLNICLQSALPLLTTTWMPVMFPTSCLFIFLCVCWLLEAFMLKLLAVRVGYVLVFLFLFWESVDCFAIGRFLSFSNSCASALKVSYIFFQIMFNMYRNVRTWKKAKYSKW